MRTEPMPGLHTSEHVASSRRAAHFMGCLPAEAAENLAAAGIRFRCRFYIAWYVPMQTYLACVSRKQVADAVEAGKIL